MADLKVTVQGAEATQILDEGIMGAGMTTAITGADQVLIVDEFGGYAKKIRVDEFMNEASGYFPYNPNGVPSPNPYDGTSVTYPMPNPISQLDIDGFKKEFVYLEKEQMKQQQKIAILEQEKINTQVTIQELQEALNILREELKELKEETGTGWTT